MAKRLPYRFIWSWLGPTNIILYRVNVTDSSYELHQVIFNSDKNAELTISTLPMSFFSLSHPYLFTLSLIVNPYFITKHSQYHCWLLYHHFLYCFAFLNPVNSLCPPTTFDTVSWFSLADHLRSFSIAHSLSTVCTIFCAVQYTQIFWMLSGSFHHYLPCQISPSPHWISIPLTLFFFYFIPFFLFLRVTTAGENTEIVLP